MTSQTGARAASRPPVFGITGWKNSGKTTLTAALVSEFSRRGLTVSTIKHAHRTFEIDHEGRDSWRHREAGAREVAIVSPHRWALMHELADGAPMPELEDIMGMMAPVDLILIEGYKSEPYPKIEARRQAARSREPIAARDETVVAIAADHAVPDAGLPVFDIDDVSAIADFIAAQLALDAARPVSVDR